MENYVKICVGKTRLGEGIYFNQPVPVSERPESISQTFEQIYGHFDAYAVFAFLSFREYKKFGESLFFDLYLKELAFHFQKVDASDQFESLKNELNIKTAFDLQNYGKSLVADEFVDE